MYVQTKGHSNFFFVTIALLSYPRKNALVLNRCLWATLFFRPVPNSFFLSFYILDAHPLIAYYTRLLLLRAKYFSLRSFDARPVDKLWLEPSLGFGCKPFYSTGYLQTGHNNKKYCYVLLMKGSVFQLIHGLLGESNHDEKNDPNVLYTKVIW